MNKSNRSAPRTSQLLLAALMVSDRETVTIGEIVSTLRRRAYGFVLLIVALVNCVPLPPGVSSLAGVPVFLVGIQMLWGRPRPWLPRWIRNRAFNRSALLQKVRAIEPYLSRIEKVARPRQLRLTSILAPRIIGAVVVLLSLYIMAPLVFTNIPPAMAAVFIAIAMIEEDGAMLAAGVVVAFIAMTVSSMLAGGIVIVVVRTVAKMFGL